jgi:hypothetical protein
VVLLSGIPYVRRSVAGFSTQVPIVEKMVVRVWEFDEKKRKVR